MAIAGLYPFTKDWHDRAFSSGGQTVWLYSDPHFGDKDLPNRPTDEEQVKMINSKVGKNDTLIILGDCGDLDYIRQLRGYKVLIMGNHDAGRTNYKKKTYYEEFDKSAMTRSEAISKMKELHPDCYRFVVNEDYRFFSPFEIWDVTGDNNLFDEVYEGPVIIGEKLILSHEPVNLPWAYNIHGHIHDTRHKDDKYHMNVCADAIGFTPVNLNQFMKSGKLAHIETIHRDTIDKATERKRKRGAK